jgi:hypothetical protein
MFERHQLKGYDKEDQLLVYELSNSDVEVVENGKTLSSPDFGEINTFCWYIANFIFLI